MKAKSIVSVSTFITLFFSLFVLLSSTITFAADDREYRKSPTGKGALTPKMIRNCIKLKKKLDQSSEKASVENDDLKVLSEELELMAEAISESEQSLDKNDADAIVEHNKNVELYQEKQTEYQGKVEEYNAQIGPYKKLAKKFKKQCDGQQYYDDDYQKVKKELGYSLE